MILDFRWQGPVWPARELPVCSPPWLAVWNGLIPGGVVLGMLEEETAGPGGVSEFDIWILVDFLLLRPFSDEP